MIKSIKILKKFTLQLFLVLIACLTSIPLYYIFVSTFKSQKEVLFNPLGLPIHLRLDNYIKALSMMEYPTALKNNIIITATSVVLIIIITSMAAYPLARLRNKLNRVIFFIFLAGMMVPYQMLIFPLYKLVNTLELINKLPGVIIIMTSVHIPFAIFLFTGFIRNIPHELEEAAFIDGCTPFGVYLRIILPLLKPVIATVVIVDSLAIWNDFITPLLFLQSRENTVMLLEVYRNVGQFTTDYTVILPMLVLSMIPILILYVFLQRYIIKGVISGSLKG